MSPHITDQRNKCDKWKDPDLWRRYYLSVGRSVADRQLCFRQLIRFLSDNARTLVLTTGDLNRISVYLKAKQQPGRPSVQWLNMTRIELTKKDINTQNPLSGAVYGIYTDKKRENLLMTMTATEQTEKQSAIILMPHSKLCM